MDLQELTRTSWVIKLSDCYSHFSVTRQLELPEGGGGGGGDCYIRGTGGDLIFYSNTTVRVILIPCRALSQRNMLTGTTFQKELIPLRDKTHKTGYCYLSHVPDVRLANFMWESPPPPPRGDSKIPRAVLRFSLDDSARQLVHPTAVHLKENYRNCLCSFEIISTDVITYKGEGQLHIIVGLTNSQRIC